MYIDPEKINGLIKKIEAILETMRLEERKAQVVLQAVHADHLQSATNLVHYLAFREFDLRTTQRELGNLGLTRFANAQGHITDTLLKALFILRHLAGQNSIITESPELSLEHSKKLLQRNTRGLFGEPSEGRRVRIMVTMPSEAAENFEMVREMVQNGMNCARINCAHDSPMVWERIVRNVRRASEEIGAPVKIAMDLAGPKIRTGAIATGPKIKKVKPVRDDVGNTIDPADLVLVPTVDENAPANFIPVTAVWLKQLRQGDHLQFRDTRKKKRKLAVIRVDGEKIHAQSRKTCYIGTGTVLTCKQRSIGQGVVGELPAISRALVLHREETLRITKRPIPGHSSRRDADGNLLEMAHISCQLPAVFDKVKVGDSVLFDDGKIEGSIRHVAEDFFDVLVTRASVKGTKLKAEKGMNFPNTPLGISGLTEKDKTDLDFVATHADIVNFSFVNSKKDVDDLLAALRKRKVLNTLGIILKIETRYAFDNLRELLLSVMKVGRIGVMIARGDLAVETGWHSIGKIQHDIVDQCGAAHVPVVWATQVLENMAKNGLPSRSEITDVASSLKTECVMLNKGPFMNEVLPLLNRILSDMETIQEKTETMLPRIKNQ